MAIISALDYCFFSAMAWRRLNCVCEFSDIVLLQASSAELPHSCLKEVLWNQHCGRANYATGCFAGIPYDASSNSAFLIYFLSVPEKAGRGSSRAMSSYRRCDETLCWSVPPCPASAVGRILAVNNGWRISLTICFYSQSVQLHLANTYNKCLKKKMKEVILDPDY